MSNSDLLYKLIEYQSKDLNKMVVSLLYKTRSKIELFNSVIKNAYDIKASDSNIKERLINYDKILNAELKKFNDLLNNLASDKIIDDYFIYSTYKNKNKNSFKMIIESSTFTRSLSFLNNYDNINNIELLDKLEELVNKNVNLKFAFDIEVSTIENNIENYKDTDISLISSIVNTLNNVDMRTISKDFRHNYPSDSTLNDNNSIISGIISSNQISCLLKGIYLNLIIDNDDSNEYYAPLMLVSLSNDDKKIKSYQISSNISSLNYGLLRKLYDRNPIMFDIDEDDIYCDTKNIQNRKLKFLEFFDIVDNKNFINIYDSIIMCMNFLKYLSNDIIIEILQYYNLKTININDEDIKNIYEPRLVLDIDDIIEDDFDAYDVIGDDDGGID